MPFEAKIYFKNEMDSHVTRMASSQTGKDKIWEQIEYFFNGENRQKAAEKEVRKFFTALTAGAVTYQEFMQIMEYYNNTDYSFLNITNANVAEAKARAKANANSSIQIENYYLTLTSTKPKNHREGKPFANWAVPILTDMVKGRDYVNLENKINADRPIIEWYLNDSAHERIFTRYGDSRIWYTKGGTHPTYVNPEWWISPYPGNWQKLY